MPSAVLERAASAAPAHPALRWTPFWDPANRGQHARNTDGTGTRCGITARLVLAETSDEVCRACYPPR